MWDDCFLPLVPYSEQAGIGDFAQRSLYERKSTGAPRDNASTRKNGRRTTRHPILDKNQSNVQLKTQNAYENYKNQIVRPRPYARGRGLRISENGQRRSRAPTVRRHPLGYAAKLRSAIEAFKQAYQQFDVDLKKDTTVPSAKVAAEQDALRDKAWRSMREYAKAAMTFPDHATAATATEVYNLFKKYGDLATMSQAEETGRLHNLLHDLMEIDASRMAATNFKPLLDLLYQCKDEYLTTVSSRARQESAVQVGIIKPSRMPPMLLIAHSWKPSTPLPSSTVQPPTPPFIDPVNAIIDRMKTVLTTRRTVNTKKGSSPPGPPRRGRGKYKLKNLKTHKLHFVKRQAPLQNMQRRLFRY